MLGFPLDVDEITESVNVESVVPSAILDVKSLDVEVGSEMKGEVFEAKVVDSLGYGLVSDSILFVVTYTELESVVGVEKSVPFV